MGTGIAQASFISAPPSPILSLPVTVGQGGTGNTSFTGLLIGNGSSAFTTYGGQTCSSGFVRTMDVSGNLTCQLATLTSDVSGVLPIANGGTNISAQVSNGINFFNGTQITSSASLVWTGTKYGVGTSTPNWLVDIAGTRPSIDLSDTGAGTNLQHWLFSSMGGNMYIGTSSDAYATSTTPGITILNNGSVGLGTSTPQGNFSVQGASAASATKGTCFRAKDVGATTFTYWFFKAGVQTVSAINCGGTGTTTITFD